MSAPLDALRNEVLFLRELIRDLERRNAKELGGLREDLGVLEGRIAEAAKQAGAAPAATQSPELVRQAPPPLPRPGMVESSGDEPIAESAAASGPPVSPRGDAVRPAPASKRKSGASLELHLGRVWFVRAGIVLLVTGLVFLGNYAYRNWIHDLPAGARLAALYVCSLLLGGTGAWFARRDGMRRFGEVVLAGGLAFFYWCSFAAHHVGRLQVIDSPIVGALLLLASAGVMIGVSLARDARVTTVFGLLLASYATVLQPLGWLSAVSNVILATTGIALMLRPGWVGPGLAAMAGSYGSFLWWQVAGAASSSRPTDPAALWFLPPTWAVFVAPGLLDRFGPGMSQRARAWFTGVNNGVFFALFSLVWLLQEEFDWSRYWQVPAVFGLVLFLLGVFGRRADKTSGGVHFSQGLFCLMFATVLKLDGYQLALSLAGESLALAIGFLRYRGRIELVFCAIAAVAAVFTAFVPVDVGPLSEAMAEMPVWSSGLVALMLTATALVLRFSRDGAADEIRKPVHVLGIAVLFGATAVGIGAWLLRLPDSQQFPVGMGISLTLTAVTLLADRRRWLPELGWVSGIFALAFVSVLLDADATRWGTMAGLVFAGGAGWLWHHRVPEPRKEVDLGPDPAAWPGISAWLHAVIVPVAVMVLWKQMEIPDRFFLSVAGLCGLAGVALAVFLRCHRFAATTVFLHLPGVVFLFTRSPYLTFPVDGFETPVLGLATLSMLFVPSVRDRLPGMSLMTVAVVSRVVTFFGWWFAWMILSPDHWVEAIAVTAAIVAVIALPGIPGVGRTGMPRFNFRFALPEETWGFLFVAGACFLFGGIDGPWSEQTSELTWRHWTVAPAFLVCGVVARRTAKASVVAGLFLAACTVFAVWATQMLVWRYGWKPVGVLWTLLGFAYVSVGLWQRLAVLRHAGFALLAATLLKLFLIDVWDFAAFTRIASFLALGLVLVLLGFFYNRFAEVLKKLFEADPEPQADETDDPESRPPNSLQT